MCIITLYVLLGDLLTVNTAIKLACDGQLASIRQLHARECAIGDMQFGAMFAAVMGKISVAALRGANTNYLSKVSSRDCQGLWRTTMGYPCAHDFQLRGNEPLGITTIILHCDIDLIF